MKYAIIYLFARECHLVCVQSTLFHLTILITFLRRHTQTHICFYMCASTRLCTQKYMRRSTSAFKYWQMYRTSVCATHTHKWFCAGVCSWGANKYAMPLTAAYAHILTCAYVCVHLMQLFAPMLSPLARWFAASCIATNNKCT